MKRNPKKAWSIFKRFLNKESSSPMQLEGDNGMGGARKGRGSQLQIFLLHQVIANHKGDDVCRLLACPSSVHTHMPKKTAGVRGLRLRHGEGNAKDNKEATTTKAEPKVNTSLTLLGRAIVLFALVMLALLGLQARQSKPPDSSGEPPTPQKESQPWDLPSHPEHNWTEVVYAKQAYALANDKPAEAIELSARGLARYDGVLMKFSHASLLGRLNATPGAIEEAERLQWEVCQRRHDQSVPKNFLPYVAHACNNAGHARDMRGDEEGAAEGYRAALSIMRTGTEKTMTNYARVLEKWGRFAKARKLYKEANAVEKNPVTTLLIATMLPLVYNSKETWIKARQDYLDAVDNLEKDGLLIPDPLEIKNIPHFFLCFQGHNDVAVYRQLDRILRPSFDYIAPHLPVILHERSAMAFGERIPIPLLGRKVKVGFIGSFMHSHAVGYYTRGIIEFLPKADFEVWVFLTELTETGGSVGLNDPVQAAIVKRANRVVSLADMSLQDCRDTIAAASLDVLVYQEIGMSTKPYVLAFSRLAPVQAMTLGHSSSSGIATIDYFVGYKVFEAPDAQKYYSERLVTFSDFSYYYPPPLAAPSIPRQELWTSLGLPNPEQAHIYYCPQTLHKLTPEFDAVFRDILERDPKGLLVFKEYKYAPLNDIIRARLKQSLGEHAPRAYIVGNMNKEAWSSAIATADVMLDSYPYGGYTTSLEAFALGAPVVTLPHEMLFGRHTAAYYRIMGITDLIATDRQHYAELAVRVATDAPFRQRIQEHIKAHSHLLFHRNATIPEWARFLKEAAENRPITDLHQKGYQLEEVYPSSFSPSKDSIPKGAIKPKAEQRKRAKKKKPKTKPEAGLESLDATYDRE
eukprot:g39210.t1